MVIDIQKKEKLLYLILFKYYILYKKYLNFKKICNNNIFNF